MGQPSFYHATVALSFQIEICNLDRTKSSVLATSLYKNIIFTKNWVTRFYYPTDDMWNTIPVVKTLCCCFKPAAHILNCGESGIKRRGIVFWSGNMKKMMWFYSPGSGRIFFLQFYHLILFIKLLFLTKPYPANHRQMPAVFRRVSW